MKAVLMMEAGSVDVLKLMEIPEPEITEPDQVKIKIKAAAVNPIDTKVRHQAMFYPDALPAVLGCDGAGEIIAVGAAVTDFKTGDEVWYCHGGLGREQGNYAEYNVINQRWLARKPKTMKMTSAAAMPLVLITAWNALLVKGNLQKGQKVLIHAGAGGVGHVAIQLAKLKGAEVFTTVSSDSKAEFVKGLGVDYYINYQENDFVEQVNEITCGQGVDLVIDTVGAEVFSKSIGATSYFGRIITLLDPGQCHLAEARMRNLLIGFELMLTPQLKDLSMERDKQIKILQQATKWVEDGRLQVFVSDVLPLQQVRTAHGKVEHGHTVGKIVLDLSS